MIKSLAAIAAAYVISTGSISAQETPSLDSMFNEKIQVISEEGTLADYDSLTGYLERLGLTSNSLYCIEIERSVGSLDEGSMIETVYFSACVNANSELTDFLVFENVETREHLAGNPFETSLVSGFSYDFETGEINCGQERDGELRNPKPETCEFAFNNYMAIKIK